MTKEEKRVQEYLICKQRGHEEDFDAPTIRRDSDPDSGYKYVCVYCGTTYWEETVLHEENVPKPKDEVVK